MKKLSYPNTICAQQIRTETGNLHFSQSVPRKRMLVLNMYRAKKLNLAALIPTKIAWIALCEVTQAALCYQ